MHAFAPRLAHIAGLVDARLANIIDAHVRNGMPQRLAEATRHAVLGGGKRFRPFLLLESAALFGVANEVALDAAAALECIHCYSLVHDDLPAMDHDELRRGKPTVWKAYDEWTAILVGDGLQALAFELVSAPAAHADPSVSVELVHTLALASGNAGMVGGQALDLEAGKLQPSVPADAQQIARLQAMKTGRLIRAACEVGAILGRASVAERAALVQYGEGAGFAFQISDDLLDAEGSATNTGKATGKDAAAGKATLVSLVGAVKARAQMDATVETAISALAPFGDRAATLIEAARFLGRRVG